ncbi:chloride channel protein [Lactobacillus selangorensis]|uniref:Chloride channel protein n=1 Tax=Lactobacillus selangorensis TaxID=81857 RepID=A0A0R2FJR0_9LACO|nr:chloride channel protein [Lactobacillus selangorensis]KRN32010.1 chloride channel protein [Lactobacillus selangorensis]
MAKKGQKRQFNPIRLRFIIRGLIVGVLVGIVVSTFRFLIETGLNWVMKIYPTLASHPLRLGAWVIGSIVIALIIGRIVKTAPEISGSGIPQVEGQLEGELDYPWWPVFWKKFVTGLFSIGSGLFLGREGPSIQLGASLAQGVAEWHHDSGSNRRIMIASGAAAGLAAAFDAPIAGTLFVLEEIYHNFSPLVWMTSLASALGADFISANVFGLKPVLQIRYAHSFPISQYGHLIVLGILLGLLGYVYQRFLLAQSKWYSWLKLPRWVDGVIPFLLVIPIGMFDIHMLGGGNQVILRLAVQTPTLRFLLLLAVIRFFFSMISYGSGLPGGFFLPILTFGAILGAIYGVVLSQLGWLDPIYITNLIIFAMAAYFACITKAPFTAILLVTEMVGNLQHLMPLAVMALTAYIVVDLLGGAPIYQSLLDRLLVSTHLKQVHQMQRFEMPVFEGSAMDNLQVRDFKWPKQSLLIGLRRGDRNVIPHGDTLIQAGDTLILLADQGQISIVRHQIEQTVAQMSELATNP